MNTVAGGAVGPREARGTMQLNHVLTTSASERRRAAKGQLGLERSRRAQARQFVPQHLPRSARPPRFSLLIDGARILDADIAAHVGSLRKPLLSSAQKHAILRDRPRQVVSGERSVHRRERDGGRRAGRRPAATPRLRQRSTRATAAPTATAHAPDGSKSKLQGRALRKEKTR